MFLALPIGYLNWLAEVWPFRAGFGDRWAVGRVALGQLGIAVNSDVDEVFFLLFLFSIDYRAGPQFFHGPRSGGLKRVALTVAVHVTALVAGTVVAKVIGYD